MINKYDNLMVNIDEMFDTKYASNARKFPGFFKRLLNRYATGMLIKFGLYSRLIDSGFIRSWFEEFKPYWLHVLEGRPIYLHDFYYLLGNYRQKFQYLETPDNATAKEFLDSWQKDTLYLLFGAVRLYAYNPFFGYRHEKWISNGDNILEYGCGIAPITKFLLNYSVKRNLSITIADIRQINSHYARYRLGDAVKFIEIEPYKNPLIDNQYNVVFMITVMEHLPDPLKTVENITNSLSKNGIFIFDYILGDGDGHDTMEAISQRVDVLNYIESRYDVMQGSIIRDESMGITVCRLK